MFPELHNHPSVDKFNFNFGVVEIVVFYCTMKLAATHTHTFISVNIIYS